MRYSPIAEAQARMHDEALARALALRRQAIDDGWRSAGEALAGLAERPWRASARLLARWRRHRAARGAVPDGSGISA